MGGHAYDLRRYGIGNVVSSGRSGLVWFGSITPSEHGDTYEVVLVYRVGRSPLVYVARPRLQRVNGHLPPHIYPLAGWNTLCLYIPLEWTPSDHYLSDLLPWISQWLFFYEVWVATGTWKGKGEHPTPHASSSSPEEPHDLKQDDKKIANASGNTSTPDDYLDSIGRALKAIYGPDADLEELLYNTRL
jgi:hypothetical protein